MARVLEMGEGISLDMPTGLDCQPKVAASKDEVQPQGTPQDRPIALLETSLPAKRSLEEEEPGVREGRRAWLVDWRNQDEDERGRMEELGGGG